MGIQRLLHGADLDEHRYGDLRLLISRQHVILEADAAVPQKHAAAIQGPHGVLSGMRGALSRALQCLARKEQLELFQNRHHVRQIARSEEIKPYISGVDEEEIQRLPLWI